MIIKYFFSTKRAVYRPDETRAGPKICALPLSLMSAFYRECLPPILPPRRRSSVPCSLSAPRKPLLPNRLPPPCPQAPPSSIRGQCSIIFSNREDSCFFSSSVSPSNMALAFFICSSLKFRLPPFLNLSVPDSSGACPSHSACA